MAARGCIDPEGFLPIPSSMCTMYSHSAGSAAWPAGGAGRFWTRAAISAQGVGLTCTLPVQNSTKTTIAAPNYSFRRLVGLWI